MKGLILLIVVSACFGVAISAALRYWGTEATIVIIGTVAIGGGFYEYAELSAKIEEIKDKIDTRSGRGF